MDWIIHHLNLVVEIFGAVTGLIYLYFSIRQNIWLWPLGIFTSSVYIYVFFASKFYADMGLQGYYLVVSIYGWYHWLHGTSGNRSDDLPVSRTSRRQWVVLLIITLVLFVLMAWVLERFTDSDVPRWDAFTTAASITATWMLARKLLEHWLIWVVVDAVSMGLYVYKGLYPTVGLFAVYTLMAVKGYVEWKKDLLQQNKA
ncbi:MAG: nicotinamide riboside transporter PnuC [Bacteroidales bacterium]